MQNGFQHQSYESVPRSSTFETLKPTELINPQSDRFGESLDRAGMSFRQQRVRKIILVHGTMAGTDALGWYGHWQRIFPGLSEKLRNTYKHVIDSLSGDKGNYTQQYAETLANGLNQSASLPEQKTAVELFRWSSENHHLGRADAAVCLVEKLLDLDLDPDERVQLWGHSHAGNVFALLTNLLGNNPDQRSTFFDSTRHFKKSSGRIHVEPWRRLEEKLATNFRRPKLDIITFGTPIRYGWDHGGFENLLHFVHHIPQDNVDGFRGKFPGSALELASAIRGEYGDFVQQTFVARTDLTPAIWSWPAWKANRELRNLLEATELKNKRFWRFKQAKRVAESGHSLLVDYSADSTANDVAGHSIYTELDWMAFHADEINKRFNAKE